MVILHQKVKPNNHGDQWVDVSVLARPLPNLVLRGIISGGIVSGGGGGWGVGVLITAGFYGIAIQTR